MTSPQLGCDPAEVSPARAGAAFSEYAKKLATDNGWDFTQAWNKAKMLEPELHARMCETTPLPNDKSSPAPTPFSAVASNKADIARKFLLPPNADEALIKAAWRGNGNQYASVDFIKVFMGVQTQLMQTTGLTSDLARRQMCQDFPDLCKAANQMPVIQAGATDTSGMKL